MACRSCPASKICSVVWAYENVLTKVQIPKAMLLRVHNTVEQRPRAVILCNALLASFLVDQPMLVLVLSHEGDVGPAMPHLVHSSTTPPHPSRWIGIVSIVRRVVVPRNAMKDRSLRQKMRILERVDDLPRLFVVVHVDQYFSSSVWMNRLEHHPASTKVHMGLET